jgi:5'-3' exonuclease
VGKKEREKMFNLYLEGLQWILCYYYRGIKSWKWYYPYHYAPMISDYSEIIINESLYNMFDLFNKDKSEPFNPYQSLLLILPKQSFNLLPKCYRDIPSQIPEYFPEKIEIDYNGKTASYESLLLLPFVEEKKILDLENKNRHLEPEEEKENKWGETFLFFKNELNSENISPKTYEIYQNKNVDLINNYEIRKCDFSFPTLKTLDYDYQLINVKQFFGKNSNITKQITITPRSSQKINNMRIDAFLREKTIFIDYPYKRLAKIKGFVYKRFFYYLYGNIVYIDNNFRLSKELIESIRYSHQKIGIYLEHPETLCYVVKFSGYKSVKDKMIRQYDESNPYYVPFEITSLNATSKDFEKFISHFDYEYSENQKKKKYVKNY